MSVDAALPQPPGWGPYFRPRLVRDVTCIDEVTGAPSSVDRGYLFHRTDVEKIRILREREASCSAVLDACEQQVSELTALPSFWNRWEGRALLIGLGFAAGVGVTVAVATAVSP